QLSRGCDLPIVPMPFRGESRIVVDTPNEGRVLVQQGMHDGLGLIDTPDFSAFRLFLDPPFAALNWLEESGRGYSRITRAGVSGGVWMSGVYPGNDVRIPEVISWPGA